MSLHLQALHCHSPISFHLIWLSLWATVSYLDSTFLIVVLVYQIITQLLFLFLFSVFPVMLLLKFLTYGMNKKSWLIKIKIFLFFYFSFNLNLIFFLFSLLFFPHSKHSICNILGTCILPFVEIKYVNCLNVLAEDSMHSYHNWFIPTRRRKKSEQSLTFYPVETDMRKC